MIKSSVGIGSSAFGGIGAQIAGSFGKSGPMISGGGPERGSAFASVIFANGFGKVGGERSAVSAALKFNASQRFSEGDPSRAVNTNFKQFNIPRSLHSNLSSKRNELFRVPVSGILRTEGIWVMPQTENQFIKPNPAKPILADTKSAIRWALDQCQKPQRLGEGLNARKSAGACPTHPRGVNSGYFEAVLVEKRVIQQKVGMARVITGPEVKAMASTYAQTADEQTTNQLASTKSDTKNVTETIIPQKQAKNVEREILKETPFRVDAGVFDYRFHNALSEARKLIVNGIVDSTQISSKLDVSGKNISTAAIKINNGSDGSLRQFQSHIGSMGKIEEIKLPDKIMNVLRDHRPIDFGEGEKVYSEEIQEVLESNLSHLNSKSA